MISEKESGMMGSKIRCNALYLRINRKLCKEKFIRRDSYLELLINRGENGSRSIQAMNRAERRRLEKQTKKNPAMTIKASELEAIKQKERQSALDAVLPLLLGLPVKVLKEKYGWGTQKRLPDFADVLLEAYEAFSKNEQSIEDLRKQVEQDCGIRFTEEIAEEKK